MGGTGYFYKGLHSSPRSPQPVSVAETILGMPLPESELLVSTRFPTGKLPARSPPALSQRASESSVFGVRGRDNGTPLLVLQASTCPKWVKVRTNQCATRERRGSCQPVPSLLLVIFQLAFAFLTISHFFSAAPEQLWKQFRNSAQQLSLTPVQS